MDANGLYEFYTEGNEKQEKVASFYSSWDNCPMEGAKPISLCTVRWKTGRKKYNQCIAFVHACINFFRKAQTEGELTSAANIYKFLDFIYRINLLNNTITVLKKKKFQEQDFEEIECATIPEFIARYVKKSDALV